MLIKLKFVYDQRNNLFDFFAWFANLLLQKYCTVYENSFSLHQTLRLWQCLKLQNCFCFTVFPVPCPCHFTVKGFLTQLMVLILARDMSQNGGQNWLKVHEDNELAWVGANLNGASYSIQPGPIYCKCTRSHVHCTCTLYSTLICAGYLFWTSLIGASYLFWNQFDWC